MANVETEQVVGKGRVKVLDRVFAEGQSVWLDQLTRDLVRGGDLQAMIERDGLRGMTTNPTIFEKALGAGGAYDEQIAALVEKGVVPEAIFEAVAVKDVQDACDLFRPLHEKSACLDGLVSIEVAPTWARDQGKTLEQARRLWSLVDRPNVMIKVPGTKEAVPAIEQLLLEGINVNVTLLFSRRNHERVMEAYLHALDARVAATEPVKQLSSVASFFVSRIDKEIDGRLEKLSDKHPEARELAGKAAIANAKLAYANFRRLFTDARFTTLKTEHGARPQRPLWASTSTKNPAYRDVLYVEQLIGPDTVDTMPPETLRAMMSHGEVGRTVDQDLEAAKSIEARVAALGIDLDEVTTKLEDDGIASFSKSYADLLKSISQKAEGFRTHKRR